MVARQMSVVKLATTLGIKGPAVSNWLSGRARPKTQYRLALERLTGIPLGCWFTDDERKAIASTGTDG